MAIACCYTNKKFASLKWIKCTCKCTLYIHKISITSVVCNRAFQEPTIKTSLSCRTEKDRGVRLNHRTAGIGVYYVYTQSLQHVYVIIHSPGILAGMWPCGIITLVRELFIAESKSQVYGHLHQFLQQQPNTAHRLSKSLLIVYKHVHNPCPSN